MAAILFKITEVGLAAMATAHKNNRKIHLALFKLGTGSGYFPDGSEVTLKGSTVYEDSFISYTANADGSATVVCVVEPLAGDFSFGEIGLFTDTNLLFAVGALPKVQRKTAANVANNLSTTYTFKCKLRSPQASASIDIVAKAVPPMVFLTRWEDVLAPSQMLYSSVKKAVVTDTDESGDYSTLVQTANGWSIQTNHYALENLLTVKTVVNGGTSVTVSGAEWSTNISGSLAASVAAAMNYSLVVESEGNEFRASLVTVSGTDVQITFNSSFLTALVVGKKLKLWTSDPSLLKVSSVVNLQAQLNTLTTMLNTLNTKTQEGLPSGMIIDWSGTVIPTGWGICDGTKGTPDLRHKFVLAAGSAFAMGNVGGSKDSVEVAHTHTVPTLAADVTTGGAHLHSYKTYDATTSGLAGAYKVTVIQNDRGVVATGNPVGNPEGAHSHAVTVSGTSGSAGIVGTDTNMPPYYALYMIMKV